MDQVPLPFIVDQHTTFTVEGDSHVHIRGTGSDGLSKRQYTMHIWCNAGTGSHVLRRNDRKVTVVTLLRWRQRNVFVTVLRCYVTVP